MEYFNLVASNVFIVCLTMMVSRSLSHLPLCSTSKYFIRWNLFARHESVANKWTKIEKELTNYVGDERTFSLTVNSLIIDLQIQ